MSLPTYQEATKAWSTQDALKLIAPYLPDCRDLAVCCRVNKEWCVLFTPVLWENPLPMITSHEHFARFYAQLLFAPNGASKIRVLDNRQWFCDPNIPAVGRQLALSVGAFRDEFHYRYHRAARAGGYLADQELPAPKTVQEGVRHLAGSTIVSNADFLILDSEGETDREGYNPVELIDRRPLLLSFEGVHLALNAVSELGMPRLPFFEKVRYLSFNRSLWHSTAFVRAPLSLFGLFAGVKVLKLQKCGITDYDLYVLGDQQLGLNQLTCLDLRDNGLTDDCMDDVLRFVGQRQKEPGTVYPYHIDTLVESAPQYQRFTMDPEQQGNQGVDEIIPDDVDEFIAWAKKREDLDVLPSTGLTHLYLSRNGFSFNFVLSVLALAPPKLRAFDCGAAPATFAHGHMRQFLQYLPDDYKETALMLDWSPIPLATALCSYQHAPMLEKLAIHHTFVTYQTKNGPCEGTPERLVTTPNEMYRFAPVVNPNIQYLELVGIPKFSDRTVSLRLIHFLQRAAVLQRDLMACRLNQHFKGRRAPRVLPGLRKLVLVFTNKSDEESISSMTEDADAERFMRESENDFSFFREERGQGGWRTAANVESVRLGRRVVDNRAILAADRGEKKAIYEAVKRDKGARYADHHVEEHFYWRGELVVIRPGE